MPCYALLHRQRVNGLHEGESMKIRVPRVDAVNAVLFHQNGDVGVVKQIASEIWHLIHYGTRDFGMSLGGNEHFERARGEQRVDESPCLWCRPWPDKHAGMSNHPYELVDNAPCEMPGENLRAPSEKKRAAARMLRCALIGSINEHIRVDDKHYRPSMAW